MQDDPEKINGNEDDPTRSSIRTYEQDVARALREKNSSISSVFLAEQQKRAEQSPVLEEKPKSKTALFVLGGIFLLIAGAAVSYGAYLYLGKDVDKVSIEEKYLNTVIADKEEIVDISELTQVEIANKLASERDRVSGGLGEIVNLIFVQSEDGLLKQLTVSDFVKKLGLRMPGRLERALQDPFSVGVHIKNPNEPFFVFRTNSYEQAFAGMLEWEKIIQSDLKPFFDEPVATPPIVSEDMATSTASSTVATTTEETQEDVTESLMFTDDVIQNKDVRILKRNDEVILLYAFPDRQTLIITSNLDTFTELLDRLASGRI